MYGIMYGAMEQMRRTTIYLPGEMKSAIEREAARRGVTEAEVIRSALIDHLNAAEPPIPQLPVFPEGFGINIAGRVDELLEGPGEDR